MSRTRNWADTGTTRSVNGYYGVASCLSCVRGAVTDGSRDLLANAGLIRPHGTRVCTGVNRHQPLPAECNMRLTETGPVVTRPNVPGDYVVAALLIREVEQFVRLSAADHAILNRALTPRARAPFAAPACVDIVREGNASDPVRTGLAATSSRGQPPAEVVCIVLPAEEEHRRQRLHPAGEMDHSIGTITAVSTADLSRDFFEDVAARGTRASPPAFWWDTLVNAAIQREPDRSDPRPAHGAGRTAHLLYEIWLRLRLAGLTKGDGYALPLTQDRSRRRHRPFQGTCQCARCEELRAGRAHIDALKGQGACRPRSRPPDAGMPRACSARNTTCIWITRGGSSTPGSSPRGRIDAAEMSRRGRGRSSSRRARCPTNCLDHPRLIQAKVRNWPRDLLAWPLLPPPNLAGPGQ